jgi:ferric-dicitrate binding protein FerR (iron transport regulator)
MTLRRVLIFICICLHSNAFAQQRERGYVFNAGELMQVSQRLAGDSAAWQIVVASAERRTSTNEFVLSTTAQKILRTFSTLRAKVNRERATLSRLVKRGAPILAEQEFLKTSSALQAHDQAVAKGDIAKAMQEGESFLLLLPTLSKAVEARRTEAVEAKLRTKTGDVDKRKGLLGAWQQAEIGDLFAESDGIRTGTNSTAALAFIDGSQIVINPNTTAVVRTSRIDKLERTAQANIALIKGSLLSQLSKQAQESGAFKLSAGKAEAVIQSSKFWASVNEASTTRIANYEGIMEVRAGKIAVTLKKNQGTVVLKGKEPTPPVELLPAPRLQWNALDTVIFRNELLLQWNPVANTTKYQIEVSSERNFSQNVQTYSTSATSFLLKNLPNETRFVRLQAFDKLGLRGADSPTYRILRSPDSEPPFIFVQEFPVQKGDTLTRYITLLQLDIQGETEPNATLLKDGTPIEVAPNGTFQFSVSLENLSEKLILLSAFDAAKNRRNLVLRLVSIRQERLVQMKWNCAVVGDTLISNGLPIQVYGTAYPNLLLSLTHGNRTYSVAADAKGNWAIALEPLANQTLTVSFEAPDTKRQTPIRTYFVK